MIVDDYAYIAKRLLEIQAEELRIFKQMNPEITCEPDETEAEFGVDDLDHMYCC